MSKVAENPPKRLKYSNVHSCERCSYKTKSLFHMKNHVRRHQLFTPLGLFNCSKSTPEKLHCMKCQLKTNLMVKFYPHMKGIHGQTEARRTNHKITKYQCEDCKFCTFSALKWLKHARNECSSGGKSAHFQFFKCKACSYKLTRKKELKEHVSNRHPDKVTWYQCKHCPFKTVWKTALKVHSLNHLNPKEVTWHKCTLCSFRSRQKGNLNQHVNIQHKDLKWYECDKCSYKTKVKSHLNKHTLNMHTPAERVLKCSDCRYKTVEFSNLQAHCWRQHMKRIKANHTYWLECEQCSFKTKLKISLNQHVLQKHTLCEKTVQKTAFKKRTDETHCIEGLFKCPHCIYRGERLSHLKAHVLNEHPSDVKWHTCDQCPFKSVWKGALKKHKLRQHSELEARDLYKCKKCPYRTKDRNNLQQHVIIKHTKAEDAKWFKCKSCPYKSKVKSHLNKHTLRLHMSDDEVYRCEFCKYKSMRLSTLNTHVLKKHGQ